MLGFIQFHFRPLGDIESSVQSLPGTYKSETHSNFRGVDKNHLNCDCINLLSMASENQFRTLLLSVHLQVIKDTKNLQSNFSKKSLNLFYLLSCFI